MADDVIALTRFRAALLRARGARRLDEIISDPKAPELVPLLPTIELFYVIKDVGLENSQELVAMASAEQIQGFFDLDAWHGHQLVPDRAWPWLEALQNAGFERLHQILDGLDLELEALLFQGEVHVYDLTMEELPENLENPAWESPDRFFVVELLHQNDRASQVVRLLEDLYRADLAFARNLLMAVKWETTAVLEEDALRWRTGRMMDLGFADPLEAMGLYQPLDPLTVKIGEGTQEPLDEGPEQASASPTSLPAPYVEPLRRGGFLADTLATVTDERELKRIFGALVMTANQSLAAERVPPGDVDQVPPALARALATISIGLESVSSGDLVKGRQALASISMRRLFRVGASLAWQLRVLASALVRTGRLSRTRRPGPRDLLDPPLDAVFESLSHKGRPSYAKALDGKHEDGERPFQSVADVRRVAHAIAEAQFLADLVHDVLRLPVDHLPPERDDLRFGALLGTAMARILLGDPPSAAPIRPDELRRLVIGDDAEQRVETSLHDAWSSARPGIPHEALGALVRTRLRIIKEEISKLPEAAPPDPRYLAAFLGSSGGN